MDNPSPPAKPKSRWELHAILCLLLLTLCGGLRDTSILSETFAIAALLGLALCMVGLFRRHPVAWWATLFLFLILGFAASSDSVDWIRKYGFRAHPLLLYAHALTAVCAVVLGLLLSVKIRGAYSGPVQPFWEGMPKLQILIAFVSPLFLILAAVSSLGVVSFYHVRRGSDSRSMGTSLKTITTAEADFRANDRDWNHVNDFWTKDVAGLYAIIPTDGKEPIKLIELSLALADSNPVIPVYPESPGYAAPKGGNWFIALTQDRSSGVAVRYRDPEVLTSQFGFLGFPRDFVGGDPWAIMVNENNTLFRQRLKDDILPSGKTPPGPMTTPGYGYWPSEAELKANWSKYD